VRQASSIWGSRYSHGKVRSRALFSDAHHFWPHPRPAKHTAFAGRLLVFHNMLQPAATCCNLLREGVARRNPMCLHAGLPVRAGCKDIATVWLRERSHAQARELAQREQAWNAFRRSLMGCCRFGSGPTLGRGLL
jgi:hypothetical protein